jgi:AraC family transcriptional regulator, regulatory protein of adaptative response / methylated-DNA-[protein]-cysteine methyltransferase
MWVLGHSEYMMDAKQCWEAVRRRDRTFDGIFYVGVRSTGVYCKPSCPSRRPLQQNVRFYPTPKAAERDGLRACLRCRPAEEKDGKASRIHELCRYIEAHAAKPLSLSDLAKRVGLSRFYLQRTFKAVVGISPKQYLEACRLESLKGALKRSAGVTEAVYDAGFGSSSRVYERADSRLGMTPSQYRQGGRDRNAPLTITHATVESPLGLLMLAATDRGLCFVQFGETPAALLDRLRKEYPGARLEAMGSPAGTEFRRWMDALNQYLREQQPNLDLPVDVRATAFQMRVWNYLRTIPSGETRSYGEVASGIGEPSATRAVARACATNPAALAIPCHRVIRGSGELGGYRWGIERKRKLLEMEKEGELNLPPVSRITRERM